MFGALGLDAAESAETVRRAEELTAAAVPIPAVAPVPPGVAAPARPAAAEVEQLILNRAILAGALELLPDTLATMASCRCRYSSSIRSARSTATN
jgi:hypothetical protein